jgi:uncharacterized protein
MKEVAISLTSLLICACASSPPIRYFVLDAVAPASGVPQVAGDPVQITSVRIPATLDRRQMVREDTPNKLEISDQYRWGAPLADMTQRVLTQDLMLRLPPGRVVLPEQPAPARTRAISLYILQFGAGAAGTIALDGGWSLVPSSGDVPTASHRFQMSRRAVTGDYAEQARVMSILLGELADSIANELTTPSRDQDVRSW